jgi:protein-tyrosine phosphatase
MQHILNFRDFGGYPTLHGRRVKRAMLFRSAHLDKLRPADLRALQALGIRLIIDLRPKAEQPKKQLCAASIPTMTIPFDIEELTRRRLKPLMYKKGAESLIVQTMAAVYFEMVDLLKAPIATLFEILSRSESYPVLIHCRAGKDRTGFAAALILRALGVHERDVVEDYLLTNESLRPWMKSNLGVIRLLSLGLVPRINFQEAFTAREQYLRVALDRIAQEHGGVRGWLLAAGVKAGVMDSLEGMLIESVPEGDVRKCQ